MESQNVCKFVPDEGENEKIHVVSLVLETKSHTFTGLRNESVYKTHYVTKGEGILHTSKEKLKIQKGDVFFTFPSYQYAIESTDGLEYMYAGYLGTRCNKIFENLKISRNNCLFKGFEEAEAFWLDALNASKRASALRVESLILYTFSLISERVLPQEKESRSADVVLLIKKYVDDNISDSELSLEKISIALSYNAKYVSSLFKRKMGTGVSDYISTVRIQHACVLMERGFTGIKGIAATCGFKDALYFSRVFKNKVGISPREYLSKLKQ